MILTFLVFLTAAFAGSSNPIFIRFATHEIPPLTFTALRALLTALLLFPIWIKEKERIKVKELYKVLPYTINLGFFAIGIQYTSATMGALLYTLAPILSAILAVFLLHEKLKKVEVIGAGLALVGTAILIIGSLQTKDIFSFGTPLGNILVGSAVFSWGFYPIGIKSLTKTYANSTILFYGFAIAGFIFLLLSPFEWIVRPLSLGNISYVTVGCIIGSALIGTMFYYFCYQWLIKHTTAFIGSLSLYGGFVAGALYGFLFLNEHITGRFAIGAVFILSGVFLATTYSQLKKRR